MLGNVEIRNLKEGTLYNLAQILDTNDDWKRFMSLIPKDLQNENSVPKYNNEHIDLIENHSKRTGEKCAKILFDEWGTSGRVRPTLTTLKQIAIKAEMLRVSDEIARILGEDPPPRPQTGPGAPVNTNISLMLNDSSSELTSGEKSRNNQTTAQMQSDNNTSNNKLQAQTTAQMMSASDMIKFSQTVESVINSTRQMQTDNRNESNNTFQGCATREMKSASDLIKFSENNIDIQTSASSEEPNLPAWSQMMVSPHTLNTKAYAKSEGNTTDNSDHTTQYPPEVDSTCITEYQQSLPNIELFQSNIQTHTTHQSELNLSSGIDKSILQDTNLIHFNYVELKAITNNFSETVLNGPYGLCGKIGQGGFGEVYVGSHPKYGPLAIKKTHQHVVIVHKPEVAVKLFNSEVKYLSQFRHENIVPIIGFSKDGPALCIVCDYVDGGSLEEKIAERVLSEKQRINIMQGAAEGLRYLHSYELNNKLSFSTSSSDSGTQSVSKTNFVHRDVKSSNILLTKDLVPKLENGDKFQIKHYIDEAIKRGGKSITDFLDTSAGVWTKADDIYKLAEKCLEADRQERPAVEEICETLRSINNK
ncbi:hypothetical protein MSG28_002703 [Choristoneura fumiferana]|uniref:Uncharacterized protein n=1 Tax=Choristoneura fumiferana TaxID=7141 RepID=A0ACC0JIZ1_CHOFU|nr:hypothetical protein MSG28_002703 [Choristoneura fumiferana]